LANLRFVDTLNTNIQLRFCIDATSDEDADKKVEMIKVLDMYLDKLDMKSLLIFLFYM
jgi:hypothetical protein